MIIPLIIGAGLVVVGGFNLAQDARGPLGTIDQALDIAMIVLGIVVLRLAIGRLRRNNKR